MYQVNNIIVILIRRPKLALLFIYIVPFYVLMALFILCLFCANIYLCICIDSVVGYICLIVLMLSFFFSARDKSKYILTALFCFYFIYT